MTTVGSGKNRLQTQLYRLFFALVLLSGINATFFWKTLSHLFDSYRSVSQGQRRMALAGELERAITTPDADVPAQHRHFRGVTKEGATISGTLLNEDKYSVQILDAKDRLVSVERRDLRESAIVEKGLMPSYKDKLTSSELADLVSYLVSLKSVELK